MLDCILVCVFIIYDALSSGSFDLSVSFLCPNELKNSSILNLRTYLGFSVSVRTFICPGVNPASVNSSFGSAAEFVQRAGKRTHHQLCPVPSPIITRREL